MKVQSASFFNPPSPCKRMLRADWWLASFRDRLMRLFSCHIIIFLPKVEIAKDIAKTEVCEQLILIKDNTIRLKAMLFVISGKSYKLT